MSIEFRGVSSKRMTRHEKGKVDLLSCNNVGEDGLFFVWCRRYRHSDLNHETESCRSWTHVYGIIYINREPMKYEPRSIPSHGQRRDQVLRIMTIVFRFLSFPSSRDNSSRVEFNL